MRDKQGGWGINISQFCAAQFLRLQDPVGSLPTSSWAGRCQDQQVPPRSLHGWVCESFFVLTGNPLFRALAYPGLFLNLFNLAPIGFMDGGHIVTPLPPWLWLVGGNLINNGVGQVFVAAPETMGCSVTIRTSISNRQSRRIWQINP